MKCKKCRTGTIKEYQLYSVALLYCPECGWRETDVSDQ